MFPGLRKMPLRFRFTNPCAHTRTVLWLRWGGKAKNHLDWGEIGRALRDIGYDGAVVIESFTADIKEIARAVSLWRPLAASQDALALEGLRFLKENL